MSMFVCVVRVTPATFELIKEDPAQLEGVFEEDKDVLARLGIADSDSAGFDYGIADDMMDAEANLEMDLDSDDDEADQGGGDDEDPVFKSMGADGHLDYDAGYGNAFTLSPAAVKKASKQSSVIEIDDEVKKLFKAAAKRGDYIIGIVS
jgi:hypothetical protein